MRARALTILLCAGLGSFTFAQAPPVLPADRSAQQVSGTIRVWGNDRMQAVMSRWAEGFRHFHPDARVEARLMGTGTAMAGLYTGVAEIALMGRPANSTEIMAFEWVFRYRPLGVQVSTGSLGTPGKSYAPVVLVHRENPLSQLTFAQLDAVFGCEHKRGPANIRTWGELGLSGPWAARAIHVYAPDTQGATSAFFRQVVLKDSYKWNCKLKEFADRQNADGVDDALRQVAEAVGRDPDGIALAALGVATPELKALALAADEGGVAYPPTVENVSSRKYPLSRATWAYVNRAPDRPLDPKVRAFLEYVLSREGQADVARGGDYIALPTEVAREQLRQVQ